MPQLELPIRASPSPAAAAINSAFESQGEQEHTDMFPASVYRSSRRASSRRPERTATFQHNDDLMGPIVGHLARPTTPSRGTSGLGLRDYSPMAASFAGISRKQARSESIGLDEKRLSQRTSLELAAQMFDGPA